MNDRNLLRGLFLIAISLAFGVTAALNYPLGTFARAGAGLFPLLVSSLLFTIGLITVVRSRFVERVPVGFSLKNIALVLTSLAGFALLSEYVNMTVGILFMVFCAGFTAQRYSIARNVKVSIALVLMALAFQKLLGVNLPLY